jgi:hypothetical protein
MEERMAAKKTYRAMVSKEREDKLKQAKKLYTLDSSCFWKRYRGPRKPLRLKDINTWYSITPSVILAALALILSKDLLLCARPFAILHK